MSQSGVLACAFTALLAPALAHGAEITATPPTVMVTAGSGSLWAGHTPKTTPPPLSTALDGCLINAEPQAFTCVSQVGRAGARAYRRKSTGQAFDSELATTVATPALAATAFSVGHAAKDTMAGLGIASLTPIVFDEVAAPGPRSKLYTVWATAMTLAVNRAEILNRTQQAITDPAIGDQARWDADLRAACGEELRTVVAAALKAKGGDKPSEDFTKGRITYQEAAYQRCQDLRAATSKLLAARGAWGASSAVAAHTLAGDLVMLDDTVTRLDREMLAPSRGVIGVIFGAVLAMPGKLAGTSAPAEFTGRSLPVFTATYTFNLTRAPDVALPDAFTTPLTRAPIVGADEVDRQVERINQLSDKVNAAISAAAYYKAANDQSVLTISPGSPGKPVTLGAPSKP